MADSLNDLGTILRELERMAIRTTQGEFVRISDVRRLMREREEAQQIEEAADKEKPKTMTGAKLAILKDPEIMKNFPKPTPKEGGRSLSASEPRSSSRT